MHIEVQTFYLRVQVQFGERDVQLDQHSGQRTGEAGLGADQSGEGKALSSPTSRPHTGNRERSERKTTTLELL